MSTVGDFQILNLGFEVVGIVPCLINPRAAAQNAFCRSLDGSSLSVATTAEISMHFLIRKPGLATVLSQIVRECRYPVLLFAAQVADLNTDNHMKSRQVKTSTLKKKRKSVLRPGFKKARCSCGGKEDHEPRLPSARASKQILSLDLD